MGYCKAITPPAAEPVDLATAKLYMNLPEAFTKEDGLIAALIIAAREQAEVITGRCLARRRWTMVLDALPYWVDTIQSSLAYPPSYYSLPRYSTTLWNYSQLIKLPYPPVISVEGINVVDCDGNEDTLLQDRDFVLDRITDPARVLPLAGKYWPPTMYVANSVRVDFTAGYDVTPDAVDTHSPQVASPLYQQDLSTFVTGIPQMLVVGILNLVAFWFNSRGQVGLVPENIERLFQQFMVLDFAGTRG
jgi:hypothetical protein